MYPKVFVIVFLWTFPSVLSTFTVDEVETWKMWVTQAEDMHSTNQKPFQPGSSIQVGIRDRQFAKEVHLHFRSKSQINSSIDIVAMRLNMLKCTHSYLNIPESNFSYDPTSVVTHFKITPSLESEELVFVSSPDIKLNKSIATEFWGWIPIHFVPCFLNDTEKCPSGNANAEAYVNVTFLDAKTQHALKQGMKKKCPVTLSEIHEILHNPEKVIKDEINQDTTTKIFYSADADSIILCTNTSEDIIVNTKSPLDYPNQLRQLYTIKPHRYIRQEGVLDVYNNCVTVHDFENFGNSFSFTLSLNNESTEVGIVRIKFKPDDEPTRFFYSDEANKSDYVMFGNIVQNQTTITIQLFADTWQYSSTPVFNKDMVTCNVEELTLGDVSYKKADTVRRHVTEVTLTFRGVLPKDRGVNGECKIKLRHKDNSIITKIVNVTLSPPPQLQVQGSSIEDGQTVLRITSNISEIHGNVSYGVLIPKAKLHLDCSAKNLSNATHASSNGSFLFKIDEKINDCEEWALYAEAPGGLSDIVLVKTVPRAENAETSSIWLALGIGTLVTLVVILVVGIVLYFLNHRRKVAPIETEGNSTTPLNGVLREEPDQNIAQPKKNGKQKNRLITPSEGTKIEYEMK